MVFAELRPSNCSEKPPDIEGDVSRAESGGLVGWMFMFTSTFAASRSWTCWCLDISSLEVYAHSGVCSHLEEINKSTNNWPRKFHQRCRTTPGVKLDSQGKVSCEGLGKGRQGHKHMLVQAAAMLISLPALVTVNLRAVEFPPLLDERLAVTRPPDTVGLLR